MKIIVVLNPESPMWKKLKDVSFNSCPPSPVHYRDIELVPAKPILYTCPSVTIISAVTGAQGIGTPIDINNE